MVAKAILLFSANILLIQSALSQCIGAGVSAPWELAAPAFAYDRPASPFAYDAFSGCAGLPYNGIYPSATPAIEFIPTSGGGLPVASASPIGPFGISVESENFFEGPLNVFGELPFVGTVGLEAVLPTAGTGIVNHSCGNGINAMVSENGIFAPAVTPAAALAPGLIGPGIGYSAGWAGRGRGCGCGF